jgi:predicted Fe-Mo cluster-binding NifX family protein
MLAANSSLHIASTRAPAAEGGISITLFRQECYEFGAAKVWSGPERATLSVMRVAVPNWTDRVSPVFDVARRLLVVDFGGGGEVSRQEAAIDDTELAGRANRVLQLGVDVLICGAISMPLEAMLASAGVRVIPHTCGTVEEVLRAFASGRLTDERFLMPGCCGRRRRFRGRRRGGRSEFNIRGGTR